MDDAVAAKQEGVTDRASYLLVAVQGLLFLGIGFWPLSVGCTVPTNKGLGGLFVTVGAVLLIVSALKLGKSLTAMPIPNGKGLAARGLYQYMRHPMYTALVVICAGVALGRGAVVVWVLTALLALLFEIKTRYEERHLVVTYPGYADYAARTGKFIPGLGKRTI